MLHHPRLCLLILLMTWAVDAAPTRAGVLQTATLAARGDAAPKASAQAVWPSGWRRTTHGWERSEQWHQPGAPNPSDRGSASGGSVTGRPESINDWIQRDKRSEMIWARLGSQWIRSVHPIALGLLLVGTAMLITRFSQRPGIAGQRPMLPATAGHDPAER